jgi:hypothetical protein
MSEFSFDPAKPSAFQRLISGRVANRDSGAAGQSEQKQVSGAGIFKEVPAVSSGADNGPAARAALSGLSSAVRNVSDSTDAVSSLGDAFDEVRRSNRQASEVSVREVQAAAQVADELQDRIRGDLQVATDAQGKGLSSDTIQRFLG